MKVTNLVKKGISLLLAMALVFSFSATSYAASISDTQKEEYYAEYVKIAKEVSEETGRTVGVLPMEQLTENDWVTPSEFRERALDFAKITAKTNIGSEISIQSTAGDTNSVSITAGNITETLYIKGSFETQYSSYHKRQVFAGINSITSYLSSSSNGTWDQIDYDYDLIDGGRTYYITVSGTYTRLGLYTGIYASTYFYCSATGAVS